MEALRQLFVSLGLDWDSAGFAQAQVAANLLEKGLAAVVDVGKQLVGVLKDATLQTAAYADDLSDAAVRTGASVEALQELGFAASQSGASAETINHALTKLSMTMSEAAKGTGEAGKAFAALGVRVTDSDGKLRRTDEVFTDLASAVARIENPTERSAKALDVFGRAGIQLLPLLNEGADGLAELRQEARDLGLVMSADAIDPAATFNDTLDALKDTFESLKRDLGGPIIEALLPVVTEFKEWVKANRALIRSGIQTFARSLAGVVKTLAAGLAWLVDNWKLLAIIATSVLLPVLWSVRAALLEQLVAFALNTAAAIAYGATQVAAALSAAAAWTAANAPLLLSIALLATLLLGAEDVYSFLTGADSLIGDIGPKWTKFLDDWTSVVDPADHPIINGLKTILFYLSDLEGRLLPLLKDGWWSSITQPIAASIELLFKLFRGTAGFVDYLNTVPGLGFFLESFASNAEKAAPLFNGSLFGGGAGSVEAAAQQTAASTVPIVAPSFSGNFVVQAQPGQSAQEVAGATREVLEEWWDSKLRTVGAQ
jgi:hypothetical protein